MSVLSARVHTFGDAMRSRHGEHKVALDAGFTCPSRDGSKGVGGCSFCHNKSFAPGTRGRIAQGTARVASSPQARHAPWLR